ncbi:MAG: hypothetical protein Q4G07_00845 [Oscillospiraceae bacterium]|nr:hypothetical protein [Oscillospiraceae bacterium]
MFTSGFPIELRSDVIAAARYISEKTYNNIQVGQSDDRCTYILQNGQVVSFPYRIYYVEDKDGVPSVLTPTQKSIYHAIFSRSCNGFVREKHLRALLEGELQEWIYPYLLKLSDEYVMEIVECLYYGLRSKNTDRLKSFCVLNLQQFLRSHARMISYWNEFYRTRCYKYKDYIGRKLYLECFGYSRSLEKRRTK